MPPTTTRAVTLKRVPQGTPKPDDFAVVDVDAPDAAASSSKEPGLHVRVEFMSVDPYLRGQMRSGMQKVGAPIRAFVSGRVVKSNLPDWKDGDLFGANLPLVVDQFVPAAAVENNVRNLTAHVAADKLSWGIGVLGMPGATAYAGIDLLGLKPESSVWVSAATGAVGSLVTQIAKNVVGAKLVVGSAGSAAKVEAAKSKYACDVAFSYRDAKGADALTQLVKKHAPNGLDAYFENVGGDHFLAAQRSLREHGRIVLCGAISAYNSDEASPLQIEAMPFIYKQFEMFGLINADWLHGRRGNFLADMSAWVRDGKVRVEETTYDGIDKWPEAFIALFEQGGDNQGKVVVRV